MSLGAAHRDVLGLVLGRSLSLSAIGVVLGPECNGWALAAQTVFRIGVEARDTIRVDICPAGFADALTVD